eukprot:6191941-Pleurochrysis_carterae.AAC.3
MCSLQVVRNAQIVEVPSCRPAQMTTLDQLYCLAVLDCANASYSNADLFRVVVLFSLPSRTGPVSGNSAKKTACANYATETDLQRDGITLVEGAPGTGW